MAATSPTAPALTPGMKVVMGAFAVSGVVHLVRPQTFYPLMPKWVPARREVVLGSGVLELACAAGMAVPATRRPAGLASALVLLGVFPGNLKMAADAQRTSNTALKVGSLARLPLQAPMIRSALQAYRG